MQIDVDSTKENSTAMNIFTVLAILLIIGIPVYGYFKLKPDSLFQNITDSEEQEEIIQEEEVVDEIDYTITGYTEKLVEIDGQWAYILAPEPINPNNLPTLVIYNHGSITFVEEDLDEDFKSDLLEYGEALTPNNYIFAVSNAHGVNWGSLDSINDNYNMYEYIKDNYGIQDKIYLIGFSMGGLPTMNFATTYTDLVSKIVLLAPTTRTSEWDQERVDKIRDIDIKVWHGTADVNIGYIYTKEFVNKIESLGKDIDFITLDGKTHWDVDTEYIDQILEFFNSSEISSE
ncbi:MAG: alpha/beta hydrolase [Candidatus Dojkabacteria bacterium]|nr:alpha/beta hydrolase [Candidatus Dojkabacteria bacterium]